MGPPCLAVLAALVVVGAAACGSDDDSASTIAPAVTGGTETGDTAGDTMVSTTAGTAPIVTAGTDRPATEDTGGPSDVAYYDEGDIDPGLAPFVQRATTDLAGRLDVAADEITTHSAVLVVWPNGALGCPQKGMSYAQVLTDGAVIELVADGKVYRYHSGGDRGPFPCAQPLDPLPQRL